MSSSYHIVQDVLSGYNGTIFAYGQTSSGKTHTMEVICCCRYFRQKLANLGCIFMHAIITRVVFGFRACLESQRSKA